jgi:hypothetical protein
MLASEQISLWDSSMAKKELLLLDLLISVPMYCAVIYTVRVQVYWEMRSCFHVLNCSYDEMEACGI